MANDVESMRVRALKRLRENITTLIVAQRAADRAAVKGEGTFERHAEVRDQTWREVRDECIELLVNQYVPMSKGM